MQKLCGQEDQAMFGWISNALNLARDTSQTVTVPHTTWESIERRTNAPLSCAEVQTRHLWIITHLDYISDPNMQWGFCNRLAEEPRLRLNVLFIDECTRRDNDTQNYYRGY
ncbi:hypothetical protein AVEN_166566-1 [Araneus ventricosus]|uniref:Uncharacterized protein n=1 Tax=Araneus ventricosus TaxID=182803 RepID=A0A4Y2L1F7_ARAVE|nr:hypothetical protein AVEN_166566-1 [Araneus ventricosus]